ncbi:MAG: ribonuclease R [Thermoanaerobaculia bacterium]
MPVSTRGNADPATRPGAEAYLQAALYRQLEAAGPRGLEADALEAPPGLEADPGRLRAALGALEAEGRVAEWSRRWYALRYTELISGRIRRLEGGDALLLTGERGEAGYFLPRKLAKGALDGDVVVARPHRRKGRGGRKGGERLPEASVVKIVRRRHRTLVGTVELDEGGRWLVPFDARTELEVEILEGPDVLEDDYVVVEVDPPRPGGHPRGRIVEVLGNPGTPGVDVRVVLRHFEIPEEFPPEALAEADAHPEDPRPEDWEGREDLREHPTITIDGASARDFDDAVAVERLGRNRFRVAVHIADVSHYVPEGSALDREAYRRGTSVYYPDRAIPMLPEGVSNGLCSLRPGVPRLALSAFLEVDGEGRVTSRRFARTVIRSDRRMTYEEVRRLLEEPRSADEAEYGEVLPMLRDMADLMEILLEARMRRGSIDFDLPEGDVILDTDGYTVGIKPGERNVAHRIIEELMIAANEAVAAELVTHEVPALYRVHDAPSREDVLGLKETLNAVGVALKGDLENLHPSAFQDVLARVAETEEEGFVSTLVLRTMQRALYHPECRGHYALASRYYTHFTSPIRRYPDLVVHRALASLLEGRSRGDREETLLAERLPGIAEHAGVTERRAEQSERDLLQWKKIRFLADRIGEAFRGHITGVQPFGLFVQLDGLYVDGLVPIRALSDDYYVHDPAAHRLVGSGRGRAFQLADPIEVRLAGVSVRHRGLDLVPVALEGQPAARAGGRSRSDRGHRARSHRRR